MLIPNLRYMFIQGLHINKHKWWLGRHPSLRRSQLFFFFSLILSFQKHIAPNRLQKIRYGFRFLKVILEA